MMDIIVRRSYCRDGSGCILSMMLNWHKILPASQVELEDAFRD
jgi:hypothetical protein